MRVRPSQTSLRSSRPPGPTIIAFAWPWWKAGSDRLPARWCQASRGSTSRKASIRRARAVDPSVASSRAGSSQRSQRVRRWGGVLPHSPMRLSRRSRAAETSSRAAPSRGRASRKAQKRSRKTSRLWGRWDITAWLSSSRWQCSEDSRQSACLFTFRDCPHPIDASYPRLEVFPEGLDGGLPSAVVDGDAVGALGLRLPKGAGVVFGHQLVEVRRGFCADFQKGLLLLRGQALEEVLREEEDAKRPDVSRLHDVGDHLVQAKTHRRGRGQVHHVDQPDLEGVIDFRDGDWR